MLFLNSWNATSSGAVGRVDRFPCRQLCIIGLDGVADVAVFGIVELTPGAELCAEDIRAYVANRMAKYKAPKVVEFEE
jgi:long-chain acyl-CoA synthetase